MTLNLALWMFQNATLENGEYVYTMSDGTKVYFTVDPSLQKAASTLISTYPKKYEGIMLFDVRSGRILAIAGYMEGSKSLYPFKINKYPAASVFKIITLVSYLSVANPDIYDTVGFCPPVYRKRPQRWLNCEKPYKTTLYNAFGASNNPAFGKIAVNVGFETLKDFIEIFHFGDTVSGIPYGSVVVPKDKYDLALLGSGFQGSSLNPIQAARMIQIASTGYDIEPNIVDRIVSKDGTILYRFTPSIKGRILDENVVAKFRRISASTVRDGTASKYFNDKDGNIIVGVEVGGKTGTLMSWELQGLTEWFVGFAPVSSPEIGVVAFSVGKPSPVKPQYLAMRLLQSYFLSKFEDIPVTYEEIKEFKKIKEFKSPHP